MGWIAVDKVEKTGRILATTHSYPLKGYETRWYDPKVYHWDEFKQYWSCPANGICITADREAKYLCVVLDPLPPAPEPHPHD